jgi:hypothetical protein
MEGKPANRKSYGGTRNRMRPSKDHGWMEFTTATERYMRANRMHVKMRRKHKNPMTEAFWRNECR